MRVWCFVAALALTGCGDGESNLSSEIGWHWAVRAPDAALLSVNGTSQSDVWLSGADDGSGPLVLHWDGHAWERRDTGREGDLWWVNALPDGPVFFGGSGALLLRFEDGEFESLESPGNADQTVFGVWAAAADDVYAVGSVKGESGFLWHYDGDRFVDIPLDSALPANVDGKMPGLFKVWGTSTDEVWAVGTKGTVLRGNASDGFELVGSVGNDTLFTVHAAGNRIAMVGGGSAGMLYEVEDGALVDRTPENAPLLQGVCVGSDGTVWAAGFAGSMYRGKDGSYEPVDTGLDFGAAESLHSIWVDPSGGVWAAGGDVLTEDLDQGLALHYGPSVPLASDP